MKTLKLIASYLFVASVMATAMVGNAKSDDQVDFRTDSNSPKLYAPDGTYLGNLNNNQFDPNSVSNQFGKYGNQFSPESINNQFGRYGNPYSNQYSGPKR